MPKHRGRAYPRVIEGEGLGIIDDMPVFEFLKIINKIDRDGQGEGEITSDVGNVMMWSGREYRGECGHERVMGAAGGRR